MIRDERGFKSALRKTKHEMIVFEQLNSVNNPLYLIFLPIEVQIQALQIH